MEKTKKISVNFIFWMILSGITVACIWKTQRAVPIMMDDDWYGTVLSGEAKLQSWRDIVQAQIWHYQNWGGRTVAHTLLQFILLYLSEPLSDLLNVALIVLLAWMINAQAGEKSLAFLVLTVGALHGLNANWKMSMYWQTGACNYLYTTILLLAFAQLYLRTLEPERQKEINGGFLVAIAAILGLLAGWTNENMGPAVWVMTVIVIVLRMRAKQKVGLWMWAGSLTCLIGSLMMILAPGNAVRSAEVASKEYGVLWQTFLRMYGVCKGALEYLFPTVLLTAGILFVSLCILGNKLSRKEGLLLVGAVLSWGAMVLSPHYPDRAAFGTMCLLLCVAVPQAAAILKSRNSRACHLAMTGIGLFIWLRGMYFLGEFLCICWGWIR